MGEEIMTNIKHYIRSGTLYKQGEEHRTIMNFEKKELPTTQIVALFEGKCRRKTELKAGSSLYENYYPLSFIGIEDYLYGSSFKGRLVAFPGSHYCIWEAEDFSNALSLHPELARRAVYELSQRVRLYDKKAGHRSEAIGNEFGSMDFGNLDEYISDMLFDFSFSQKDDDSFSPEIIEKFSRKFSAGEYLMKQGEKSLDLYIVLSGRLKVLHHLTDGTEKEDYLGSKEMVGEMAQFDGLPRSADVIAEEATETLVFPPEHSSLLFQLHPNWPMKILRTLAKRLGQRRRELAGIEK